MQVVQRVIAQCPRLAVKIRKARLESDKTGKVLAAECGITYSAWHAIETGRQTAIKLSLLRKMEKALGVDFEVEITQEDVDIACNAELM